VHFNLYFALRQKLFDACSKIDFQRVNTLRADYEDGCGSDSLSCHKEGHIICRTYLIQCQQQSRTSRRNISNSSLESSGNRSITPEFRSPSPLVHRDFTPEIQQQQLKQQQQLQQQLQLQLPIEDAFDQQRLINFLLLEMEHYKATKTSSHRCTYCREEERVYRTVS